MSKIHKVSEELVAFYCPACKRGHLVRVKEDGVNFSWQWNQDVDVPTLTPSLNIVGECHSIVTNGEIEFLSDSTHKLAGKKVPLPDWYSAV